MKIHIIGAGPTGMSLAWELAPDHDVTIYDRKVSAGGSWWEPEIERRDLHAHRIVFDRAFVNTHSLFEEMGIKWETIFKPAHTRVYAFLFRSLGFQDYMALASLAVRVLLQPAVYKFKSLKDALGELTDGGQSVIEHLPLIMDGVTWDVMSAYEFVKSYDHVGLSNQFTQRGSGKIMCDAMEEALLKAGVNFIFGTELQTVEYHEEGGHTATFSDGRIIEDGYLFLCLDNSPALKFLGTNWGPDAEKKVRESTYGAINVLLDYESAPELKTDLEIAARTKWNIQPVVLSDKKTVSCVICNLTEEILGTDADSLIKGVMDQLGLPDPLTARIGWGAEWDKTEWVFTQSSGVLSLHGQLPFFGKCPMVAMCGMMSPRHTPYASIEAAVEVSRRLSHECFGTREPLRPIHVTDIVLAVFMVLIVLRLVRMNEVRE